LLPERVDSRDLVSGMSELLDRTLGERIKIDTKLDGEAWPCSSIPTSSKMPSSTSR
jgi:hypothetical protein